MKPVGLVLVLVGLGLVVVGLLAWAGAFSWFGRLPGDFRWEGPHTRIYLPLTSMLLLSLVLNLLILLVRKLL